MSSTARGYLYAFIATICGSLVYLFSKAALNEVTITQFGFYWFLTALFFNSLMALHPRGGFSVKSFTKSDYRTLLFIGIIEIIATTAFYEAISVSENPAVPSFLRNLEYLFVTIFGVMLLNDRFSGIGMIGAFLTLSGAFIISSHQLSGNNFFSGTAGLMLLSTFFYAIRTILAKKHIREISPVVLALNRALFLFLIALAFLLMWHESFKIPLSAFLYIVAGSFVGPFLTSIFQYSSLRYIEASRAAIVQSTTGLFVLTGALLIFGSLPADIQIIGGILSITGVVFMIKRDR